MVPNWRRGAATRAWGAVAQLPKPFQASALLALVAEVLGARGHGASCT